jgi:hypothetical protein
MEKACRWLMLLMELQNILLLLLLLLLLYRVFFNKLDRFTALWFTVTGTTPAAKRTRILPMTQHADNIWNEGEFLPLFTDHRRCWKCCPSTRKYLLQLTVSLKHMYNNPSCT